MSDIKGYRVGGTIHLIINNQIGFTTSPQFARWSLYCTDVAKTVQAPIFHVNGDDPEACVRVAQLAFEYRQRFHKDVVIDMVCYRRHGHNEGDDPSYTQPLMYKAIAERRSVRKLYVEALVKRGDITVEEAEGALADFQSKLQVALDADPRARRPRCSRRPRPPKPAGVLPHVETGCRPRHASTRSSTTSRSIRRASRRTRSSAASSRPAPSTYHETGEVDWATAEALAIGSLVLEGTPVRLAGEDTPPRHVQPAPRRADRLRERERLDPARHAAERDRRTFWVYDSAAQRVRRGRLRVRLLARQPRRARDVGGAVRRLRQRRPDHHRPVHRGRRGQVGPVQRPGAAAAARLRGPGPRALLGPHRALPAVVRRGQHPGLPTPRRRRSTSTCCAARCAATSASRWSVFTPKAPLRMKESRSPIDELTTGSFEEVLDDPSVADPDAVRRLVFCSGKVAWDAIAERDKRHAPVAIIRVEQLYPFPPSGCSRCSSATRTPRELVWLQEEPENMGPWRFVEAPHMADQGARLRPAPCRPRRER